MYTGQFRIIEGGSGSVEQKKSSLRAYMKRRRGENENRDVKENGLVENFFSTRAMEKESFFVYLSYSSEAPTDKLISRLLKAGKTVYAPRVEGRDMEAVLSEKISLCPNAGYASPSDRHIEAKSTSRCCRF